MSESNVPQPQGRPLQNGGRFSGQAYRCSQAEYSARYGKPLVTIKRWWKRRHPLDDPDAMGEYLSPRGRKKDEPEEAFDAPSIVRPADSAQTEEQPPATWDSPVSLDASFFDGQGVLAAIERLQKAERERAAAYFGALLRNGGAVLIQNRFKEWVGIVEALRKLEKDAPEIRKQNRLTIDRAEAEADVGKVFGALSVALNSFSGRATNKLLGITTREEILDILDKEIAVLRNILISATVAAAEEEEP